jgi:anti-sigma regulatory factor (Ser/Thr protein kinase)
MPGRLVSTRFVHPALFYRSDADYLNKIVPFVTEGLERGHAVAVAVPEPRLRLLGDALGEMAQDVTMLNMAEEGRNPGRIIAQVLHRFIDRHADQYVRVVGEPVWAGRTEVEYPACVQHEALINVAFAERDVTIICPYDLAGLPDTAIVDAYATHPVVWGNDGGSLSDAYDPGTAIARYNQPFPAHDADTVTVTVPRDVLGARRFAARRAQIYGLVGDRVQHVALIVTELVTNSIMHTPGPGRLSVFAEGGYVVCEVRDPGVFTDPLAGRRPADPNRPDGRGLLLVNDFADLVRVYTGDGTTIRALIEV